MRPWTAKDSLPDAVVDDDHAPSAGVSEVGDLWRIVWCRREWVAAVTALCVALAIVYVVIVPQQYAATAQILIDPRDRQILTKDVNPDTLAADGGILQVESQSRLIESDAVLLRAVKTLGLDADPDYDGASETGLSKTLGALGSLFGDRPAVGANDAENRALRTLRKNLAVKRADKVFVVDVVVSAKTAVKAARIADAIADAYLADQVDARSTASMRASNALGGQLEALRDAVRDAEARAGRYKADHDIVGTDRELVTDQQLDNINAKLADARAKTAEQRARVQQLESLRRSGSDSGATPEAQQSAVITQLRASYQDLLRRESDLRTKVGDRHPDLIAMMAQVAETKRQIGAELARLAHSAQSDLDRAVANEHSLEASLNASKQKTLAQNEASIQLHELDREVEAKRSVYQAFLARAGETKAQADIDTLNARIISRAIPPDRPSWPTRTFILLSAIGGGFGLGIGLALLLEYGAPTVLSSAHLQRIVEAPVFGLPGRERGMGLASLTRRWRKDERDSAIALALARLVGPLAALRTTARSSSLLLTSSEEDGDVRLGLLNRLAETAATHDLSILLVDADLANAAGQEPGFLDVLHGRCALNPCLVPLGHGVRFLGAGSLAASADDLGEAAIDGFLREAGLFFDLVVFDAGVFDRNLKVAALAARVDEVLLVTVKGVTRLQAAADTTDAVLTASGRPISAALLYDTAA